MARRFSNSHGLRVEHVKLDPSDQHSALLNAAAERYFRNAQAEYLIVLRQWERLDRRGAPRPESYQHNFFHKAARLRPEIVFPALIDMKRIFREGYNVAVLEKTTSGSRRIRPAIHSTKIGNSSSIAASAASA